MRAAVRAFLEAEADPGSDVDGAVLVFGELVANVVRHAPGAIVVRITWNDDGPRLTVEDRGPGLDELPEPALDDDPWRESGRGFAIVETLARRVRVRKSPLGGARVDVILPVHRRDEVTAALPAGTPEP